VLAPVADHGAPQNTALSARITCAGEPDVWADSRPLAPGVLLRSVPTPRILTPYPRCGSNAFCGSSLLIVGCQLFACEGTYDAEGNTASWKPGNKPMVEVVLQEAVVTYAGRTRERGRSIAPSDPCWGAPPRLQARDSVVWVCLGFLLPSFPSPEPTRAAQSDQGASRQGPRVGTGRSRANVPSRRCSRSLPTDQLQAASHRM
jgi:hypothetical protein